MPAWTLVLADSAGVTLTELEVPVVMRWEESQPMTAKFPLPHDDEAATFLYDALSTGLPQMRAYLDGELKFSGRWAPMEESSDASQSVAQVTFKSPLAGLEQRFRDSSRTFTATDQATIAWDLIFDENALHDTGLIQGTLTPTVVRDRTYEAQKQILEALTQLSEVDSGLTFWETPLDPTSNDGALAAFNAGPRPGTDKTASVRFEMGDGTLDNTVSVSRQLKLPINHATVVGAGDPPLTGFDVDADSIIKYGRWEAIETQPDISEQATLDARATAMLVPDPLQVVTFEPDPAEAPRPWDEWWLGDTVAFLCDQNALQIAVTQRPTALEIELDDQMNEAAWRIEYGDQRALTGPRLIRQMLRRVAALERKP